MISTTNVYFLQAKQGGPIKIGKATDCKYRLKQHQTSHWQKLIIILIVKNCHTELESELHTYFKEYRIKGEWFKEDIIYDVRKLMKAITSFSFPHRNMNDNKKNWLIWTDLSYKIKLYSDNKDRRTRVSPNELGGKIIPFAQHQLA